MAGATTATATSRRIREHLREDLREERDAKRRERAQIGPWCEKSTMMIIMYVCTMRRKDAEDAMRHPSGRVQMPFL